jgi:hypothetical protein
VYIAYKPVSKKVKKLIIHLLCSGRMVLCEREGDKREALEITYPTGSGLAEM